MISFREIMESDAEILLEWRSKPRVARWMRTAMHNDPEKQLAWIRSMREKPDSYHWIAQIDGQDAGYVKFNDYDASAGTAEEGCYIGADHMVYQHAAVLKVFYEALLERFNLNALLSNVIKGNKIVNILAYLGNETDMERQDANGGEGRDWLAFRLDRERFFKKFPPRAVALLPMTLWKHKNNMPGGQ